MFTVGPGSAAVVGNKTSGANSNAVAAAWATHARQVGGDSRAPAGPAEAAIVGGQDGARSHCHTGAAAGAADARQVASSPGQLAVPGRAAIGRSDDGAGLANGNTVAAIHAVDTGQRLGSCGGPVGSGAPPLLVLTMVPWSPTPTQWVLLEQLTLLRPKVAPVAWLPQVVPPSPVAKDALVGGDKAGADAGQLTPDGCR